MTKANLNSLVAIYKKQLDGGEIQVAYTELVKFVTSLKTRFSRTLCDRFSVGGIFQGYMDYTYFYFANAYLKKKKLKLGLVLNHVEMRFEIWLLGQTKDIQKHYWKRLKNTEWIQSEIIPKYSVFEHVLIKNPDFNDLDILSKTIEERTIDVTDRILQSLSRIEQR
jgi:hypothetical protein